MSRPPSVDQLARSLTPTGLPHPLAVEVARQAIADDAVEAVEERARHRLRRMLTPVINATGVLLHTNLGRAPMAHAMDAGYANLELDLTTGRRGSRQAAVGELLATACGAEAAMVVNNCASAALLGLAAMAPDGPIAVSRGELVEIGGAFRVPDVMAQSGAALVEVGTTNRTRTADYRKAVDEAGVATVLKVHQSNYRIVGFTEEASIRQLAGLGVPVLADIGSGLLDAACPWLDGPPPSWLADEPAARQSLADGADLVMFSGDKLFGGPQAGIIAGSAELVRRCAKHPLARALRPGGLVLSALQETTLAYLRRDGDAIPFWRMVTRTTDELRARAEGMVEAVASGGVRPGAIRVVDTEAMPGGGTLPTVTFPSAGVGLDGDHTDALRHLDVPVIARVDDGATVLDLRTVDPDDDATVAEALRAALTGPGAGASGGAGAGS
ncbi:MAG: L-seryl-tRNA(Sec) selenium transferase [Actinomycetota bacterium]